MTVVPVFTFFVALWLLAFYFMNAGKLVNYISAPVMGGFITGICTTIILMQAPKLMGSAAGTGELFELKKLPRNPVYTTAAFRAQLLKESALPTPLPVQNM